ncbi:hypothetical protein JTB14_010753 [Gonioctena quinquepunctata]|nr:hypothetical protein JTB14_010753 [Gonioctena quinquepunctata]
MGLCIEELGKHTYQELRGATITANDLEKLSKDRSLNQGILNESVRHRVLIYLSLLSSRNYSVAGWLFRKLLRTEQIEKFSVKDKGRDELLHSEFLLMFTMALHHPAFTFEHKQFFGKILENLINIRENRISSKHTGLGYPPGFGYPTHQKCHQVPAKKAVPTSCGDSATVFHQPPGLSHLPPQPHIDFMMPFWNRPGFPYGAPEVPPFPAPTISPLVSQAASPTQSRSTSPHRTSMSRPPPPSPSAPTVLQPPLVVPSPVVPPPLKSAPLPNVDGNVLSVPVVLPQPLIEQLSQAALPAAFNSPPEVNLVEEDTPKVCNSSDGVSFIIS